LALIGLLWLGLASAQRVNFDHLDFLTDRFYIEGERHLGVWIYAEPSPADPEIYTHRTDEDEGAACVDDVARAAIAYLWGYRTGVDPGGLDKARELLMFVMAMQAEDGDFYNFVFPDGQINRLGITSRKGAGWWAARAVWALAEGYAAFYEHEPEFAAQLETSLLRALPPFSAKVLPGRGTFRDIHGFQVPAWLPDDGADMASNLLLGLAHYLALVEHAEARLLLNAVAEGISAFQYGPPETYPFLAHLPFARDPLEWHAWGSRQAQALARAYEVTGEAAWLESAEAEAGHFFVHLLAGLGPIESMRPAVRAFPQIAYGMESLASGLFALADATGKDVYNELGGLMAGWLLGNNVLRQSMYDPATGRVFDGLERGVINRNSGAESTITGLMALLQAEARPLAAAMLDYQWLARHDEVVVELELGTDFGQPPKTEIDTRASGQVTAILEAGASIAVDFELERGGSYRVYALSRAEPWESHATVFLDRQRLGVVTTGPVVETHFRMVDLGVVTLAAGPRSATVQHTSGRPIRFDALVLRPLVMEKLYGKPGERLLLLKSWSDTEVEGLIGADGLAVGQVAQVRVFDRQANFIEATTVAPGSSVALPPFGFALARWSTEQPLPEFAAEVRVGPEVKTSVSFEEGVFVALDLSGAFNNDAFSDPSNPRGNFDNRSGVLGATYPAERAPTENSIVEVSGALFRFPPTSADANNIALKGQTLLVPEGRYSELLLLGASEQGSYQATVRFVYQDETSNELTLGLSDWCQLPRYGEVIAYEFLQRRGASGAIERITCRIYFQTLKLRPDAVLTRIILPDRDTMHLFALTLRQAEGERAP
jgi:hypothetical protein